MTLLINICTWILYDQYMESISCLAIENMTYWCKRSKLNQVCRSIKWGQGQMIHDWLTCTLHDQCVNQIWQAWWLRNSPNKMTCELMLTYDTPALRQTGSRNLTGKKTLPTIWSTYMKLVTKYQISAINSCREKCN
jgi:hypothetical protein